MRIAVMQPYFFPYIGYWQLIHAADCFVLLDDVQYIRHGWVNRNRILKPSDGWQYILVPLQKHAMKEPIRNVLASPDRDWKQRILGQLAHYRQKTREFQAIHDLIRDELLDGEEARLSRINAAIVTKLSRHLGMATEIILSSEHKFQFDEVGDAGEWALRIAEQMGASEYINPIGGAQLFDAEKFASRNIKLSFLASHDITYDQRRPFEPALSIIDLLMFNGMVGTREFLDRYSIESGAE